MAPVNQALSYSFLNPLLPSVQIPFAAFRSFDGRSGSNSHVLILNRWNLCNLWFIPSPQSSSGRNARLISRSIASAGEAFSYKIELTSSMIGVVILSRMAQSRALLTVGTPSATNCIEL
jgi:hypothetical protein